MEMSRCFLLVFLIGFTFTVIIVHAQDGPKGFISIDCGIPEGSNYTDGTTGIYYSSDAGFIDSGENKNIQAVYITNSLERQFVNVRSFPQGTRNCYTLRLSQGKGYKYLIRARFLYGNYDSRGQPPNFDLYLGVDPWSTVQFDDSSTPVRMEMIHILSYDYIQVCLINTGLGTPFISALELRLLNSSMYVTQSGSLQLAGRVDFGSRASQSVRYKDDIYDRIWEPLTFSSMTTLATKFNTIYYNVFQVPSIVMSTAITPRNASDALQFGWIPTNVSDQFYAYMHFGEVEALQVDQSRKFKIYINEELSSIRGPIVPGYLGISSIYSTSPLTISPEYTVSIIKTRDSTFPPIINAFEIYTVKRLLNLQTDENDVAAILSIKKIYEVQRNWQGDPCAPTAFVWDGLSCSSDGVGFPRIIALNLSTSGLIGEIASAISNLTIVKSLDLSYNNLSGQLPDFLAQLASLSVLNLKGNNFSGTIPAQLLEKRNKGLLLLSIDDSLENKPDSSQSVPCKKKKKKIVIPVVASVVPASFVVLALLVILWMIRREKKQVIRKVETESSKRESSLETKKWQFTYSDVLRITNNFQRVIGRGGFGTVYHGCIDKTQVAVKMLSPSSIQGYKEFQAEAKLLMNVNHKNLTSPIGYCHEAANMGIIYEFMVYGNLKKHLSDKNSHVLGWQERLQIAIDASQGLEYLHHGCKPPIIHRDVKSTNILLNEKFQAKLADFGLSRVFPIEGGTHVSTMVVGTPGHVDPDYYACNRLTEKSDVYSFGVVLLEIIMGREAITTDQNTTHIIQWVTSMIQNGDVKSIADPRLMGDFDVNSVWRAVELAMACVHHIPARRPTMTFVVTELKDCLETEIAQHETGPKHSIRMPSMGIEIGFNPRAR